MRRWWSVGIVRTAVGENAVGVGGEGRRVTERVFVTAQVFVLVPVVIVVVVMGKVEVIQTR